MNPSFCLGRKSKRTLLTGFKTYYEYSELSSNEKSNSLCKYMVSPYAVAFILNKTYLDFSCSQEEMNSEQPLQMYGL